MVDALQYVHKLLAVVAEPVLRQLLPAAAWAGLNAELVPHCVHTS